MIRAWFQAVTAVDPDIARPFALGGGVAAGPDEPSEDFFLWDERDGVLVATTGMFNADGHLGTYLDARAPAGAFADAAFASATSFEPAEAVHEATRTIAAIAARGARYRDRGTAVEIAVLRFRPDGQIDLAQQGGQAFFRRRGARTERLIRIGSMVDELGPQADPALDVTPIRGIASDGRGVDHMVIASLDWQAGDRFLLSNRGVHSYVEEAEIDAALALDPAAILPALLAAARRTAHRRDQPSAAVLVLEAA